MTAAKNGGITYAAHDAQEMLAALAAVPIDVIATESAPGQILALALRFELTSYDAAYPDLALARQLPVATRNKTLAAAARAAGVGVVA